MHPAWTSAGSWTNSSPAAGRCGASASKWRNRLAKRSWHRTVKILLVEDDVRLATAVQRLLKGQNYVVDHAESLRVAREAVLGNAYAIVLLDRRLPDGEGTALIRFARRNRVPTRFLILSALGDLERRVEGLDLGADDYLVKPFEPEELLARIRAAVRRPLPVASRTIEVGDLQLDCAAENFRIRGETVIFPRREMVVLSKLMHGAGGVVRREKLESAMYGYDEQIQSNALESHVSRLRKNLAERRAGVVIHTVRGVGYMLREQR